MKLLTLDIRFALSEGPAKTMAVSLANIVVDYNASTLFNIAQFPSQFEGVSLEFKSSLAGLQC